MSVCLNPECVQECGTLRGEVARLEREGLEAEGDFNAKYEAIRVTHFCGYEYPAYLASCPGCHARAEEERDAIRATLSRLLSAIRWEPELMAYVVTGEQAVVDAKEALRGRR